MAPHQRPPRQPLGTVSTTSPRQSAPGPATPSVSPRRPRAHWSRYLETDYIRNTNNTNTTTEPPPQPSSRVQREYPGIKPNASGSPENDPYSTNLETFTIRCISNGHATTVHSAVVLPQSPWLRDALGMARARQERLRRLRRRNGTHDDDDLDDDNPLEVGIPRLLGWWQVAWVLEYMYTGQVPGFHTLTREEAHLRNPGGPGPVAADRDPPRSIAWGLAQLWGAAAYFGLEQLARRAERALWAYLRSGLRQAAAVDLRRRRMWGAAAGIPARAVLREERFKHELMMVTQVLFHPITGPLEMMVPLYDVGYMGLVLGHAAVGQEWTRLPRSGVGAYRGAQHGTEARSWERSIFEEGDRIDDDSWVEEDWSFENYQDHANDFGRIFQSVLVDLCMESAQMGLFDVQWFQMTSSVAGPLNFQNALWDRMQEPGFWWLRIKYPDAPWSFEAREEGSLVSGMTGSSFQRW